MTRQKWKSSLLGTYLIFASIIFSVLLVLLWYDDGATDKTIWDEKARIVGTSAIVTPDFRLILLVILTGALGSYVHAATSFATYTGNRSLIDSWHWWYVLRPFIGMALALIFYFALRGGHFRSCRDVLQAGDRQAARDV